MDLTKDYEHYKFIADSGQSPLRVDKFLLNFIKYASRNKIQQAAENGNIKVNGVSVKSSHKVKSGDEVTVVYDYPKKEFELIPEDIPLDIVYDDDDLLIVNKRAGMVVHPGFGNYQGTLVNALAYHFNNLPNKGDDSRPGLVHRLDKNTSGLLVIAKNEKSLTCLSNKFLKRDIRRKYIALVWGDVKDDSGTIIGNIGRDPKNRKVMRVFKDEEIGKHAVTHYKVIERFRYTTLIECSLETGRTHQIRVHLKYLGHPLFNDIDYGGDSILKGSAYSKYKQFIHNCFSVCPRHALHAKSLGFTHPITYKDLDFQSEIPQDMNLLIEKWRNYTTYNSETK
tara:strand:- start:862 stop:1875 length:1014 start_codon:yes stop_codon:yes gene_type:complete